MRTFDSGTPSAPRGTAVSSRTSTWGRFKSGCSGFFTPECGAAIALSTGFGYAVDCLPDGDRRLDLGELALPLATDGDRAVREAA